MNSARGPRENQKDIIKKVTYKQTPQVMIEQVNNTRNLVNPSVISTAKTQK